MHTPGRPLRAECERMDAVALQYTPLRDNVKVFRTIRDLLGARNSVFDNAFTDRLGLSK